MWRQPVCGDEREESIMPGLETDRSQLPIRRPSFAGKVKRTLEGSTADWNQASHVQPPEGAPNVLLVLIDDAGFGNPSRRRTRGVRVGLGG
jgi:hypothetical protein